MKKILCFMLVFVSLFILTACSKDPYANYDKIEMSYYDEMDYDGDSAIFNTNLFYQNKRTVDFQDPCVIYIDNPSSSEYGYFYLYGTCGGTNLFSYRSKNMVDWEPMGSLFGDYDVGSTIYRIMTNHVWAPEVIFDNNENMYYLFFSATPEGAPSNYYPFSAKSRNPYGPFELIEHEGYTFESQYVGDDGNTTVIPEKFFSSYLTFNPSKIYDCVMSNTDGITKGTSKYIRCIDFHPFVDPNTQKKYLYFTNNQSSEIATQIIGIEMADWETPLYDTFTMLTMPNFYTVGTTNTSAIEKNNRINEGAWVNEHNGKYYLTLSINSYEDKSYSVIQAVADSPLGPFRKLTPAEGGVLLSTDQMTMDNVSGPGHHSIVEYNGEMYVFYHTHNNTLLGGGERHVVVDKLSWVTITDINGNSLDVMYANGPTTSIQPKPISNYKNIIGDATITATGLKDGSDVSWLTDGLLSVYKYENKDFVDKYIQESQFKDKGEIVIKFSSYQDISAIMIYNSKWKEYSFYEIERIDFLCVDKNGNNIVKIINNLAFDWNAYTSTEDEDALRGGSAAIAEFDSIRCIEIRITISAPSQEQNIVTEGTFNLSEIVVLGGK